MSTATPLDAYVTRILRHLIRLDQKTVHRRIIVGARSRRNGPGC
jgi:hypothetical protein